MAASRKRRMTQSPAMRTRLNPETAQTEYLPNRAWKKMMVAKARKRDSLDARQEAKHKRKKNLVALRRRRNELAAESRKA